MQNMWNLSFPWWHFFIRAAVVYIAVLIMVRLGGKRQIGQMGVGEFVAILLISNAVQNSMNGGDNSITGGLMLALVIILLSLLYAYLAYKSPKFESIVQGDPTILIHDGRIRRKALQKEWLSVNDLKTMLRRQGIHDLGEVREAILESNGSITVFKKSEPEVEIGNGESS